VIFGTDGGAIGGMRIAAGSGGGAMDVVEIMATKKGRGGFLSSLLTIYIQGSWNSWKKKLEVASNQFFGPQKLRVNFASRCCRLPVCCKNVQHPPRPVHPAASSLVARVALSPGTGWVDVVQFSGARDPVRVRTTFALCLCHLQTWTLHED
jgi:hypothetical protein